MLYAGIYTMNCLDPAMHQRALADARLPFDMYHSVITMTKEKSRIQKTVDCWTRSHLTRSRPRGSKLRKLDFLT